MMSQIEVYDPKVGPMPEGHDMASMDDAHMLHQGSSLGQTDGANRDLSPSATNGNTAHASHH
jgi:hypothetical protein